MNIVPPMFQHHQFLLLLHPNQVYFFKWIDFPIIGYLEEALREPPPPNIQECITFQYRQDKEDDCHNFEGY